MIAIGYVRVSTDRQAEYGVSLDAQEAKIRAMATVQGAELIDVIVDGGESAKSLNRPGLQRLMELVNGGKVQGVIVAKLDRLTRSVKVLGRLLELFEKRKVALISVAESLDTGSAAGRLVITIMGAVSMGARGHRRKNPRRFAAQAKQWGARGQHRIWLPIVCRPAASGTGSDRAIRARGDSGTTSARSHPSRHRRHSEQPRAPHAPRYWMAVGIGGESS